MHGNFVSTSWYLKNKSEKPLIQSDEEIKAMDSHIENVIEMIDGPMENPQSQLTDISSVRLNTIREKLRRKKELRKMKCKHIREARRQQEDPSNQPSTSRARMSHALKKLTHNSTKFMENFDPERSNRERRKLSRKVPTGGKKQTLVYDERGWLLSNGKDLCDCMEPHCPGCHFPCPRCQSSKCGHECRVNRKWTYEDIEIDGTKIVLKPDGYLHKLIL